MGPQATALSVEELQSRLCAWEKKYGMTSAEFERLYFSGGMGDDPEIMQWIRDYTSYRLLLKKLPHPRAVGV